MKLAIVTENDAALALGIEASRRGHDVTITGLDNPATPAISGDVLAFESRIEGGVWQLGSDTAPTVAVSADLAPIAEADVILMMIDPHRFESWFRANASLIREDAIIVVMRAGFAAALVIARILAQFGREAVTVCQISTPYTTMRDEDGTLVISKAKKSVPVGIYPGSGATRTFRLLRDMWPQLHLLPHALASGLVGLGLAVHPVAMVLNVVGIEKFGPYEYDGYDITPAVGRVAEHLDQERLALLRELNVGQETYTQLIEKTFGVTGETFYEAIHKVEAYKRGMSPATVQHRYLLNDVPLQLVPAAELSHAFGLATPIMDALISLSSALTGRDLRAAGLNMERLGLSGKSRDEILTELSHENA